MDQREFLVHTRLEASLLEAWLESGWLLPARDGDACDFSAIDLARARLIRDLQHELGVNDEAVPIILDLLDQLHGVRRTLAGLLTTAKAPHGP